MMLTDIGHNLVFLARLIVHMFCFTLIFFAITFANQYRNYAKFRLTKSIFIYHTHISFAVYTAGTHKYQIALSC